VTIPGLEPLSPGRPRVAGVVILYLVRLRRRWVAELMATLAVVAGVALAYAAAVAATSPTASIRALSDGLLGDTQLQLIARGGTLMSQDLYDRVAALPDVRSVAPVLQVPGSVVGRRGEQEVTFFGADPRIVKLRGSLLAGFTGSEASQQETAVLPAPVARAVGVTFGEDARVRMAGRTLTLPVIVAGRGQIGALVNMPITLVPLRYLQRLVRTGPAITRMLIETGPGREAEVRAAVGRVAGTAGDVVGADHDSRLFAVAARPMDRAARAFAILAVLAGILLATCALVVTAAGRRRLAVQQWSQGVRPSARIVTLLVDAAAVGVVGTVLGLALGEALSGSASGRFSDASVLAGAFPVDVRRVVTGSSVALAVAAGGAAAATGVLAPLRDVVAALLPRRARRTRAPGDTGPGTRDRRRSAFGPGAGLVGLGGAIAVLAAAPGAMAAGLIMLMFSVVLVVPAAVAAAVAALGVAERHFGQPPYAVVLAVQHLRSRRWRAGTLATATSAALVVFAVTALHGTEQGLRAGLDRAATITAAPGIWVAPRGTGSVLGTTPFDARATAAAIARRPGIARVSPYASAFLDVAGHRAWVVAVPGRADPVPAHELVAGDAATVARRIRHGGWATLSTDLARTLHAGVGDAFVLPAPRPIRLRVAATTTNLGWASGAIVLGAADLRRAWAADAVSGLQVQLTAGVAPIDGRAQVARAVGGDGTLRVESAAQRADRQRAASHAALGRLRQIAMLTLLAGLLALAATVSGLLWQRRFQIARLRYDGATGGHTWRGLLAETGLLLGTGAVLGVAFGLLGQVIGAIGLRELTGFPVVVALRPGIAAAVAGMTLASGLAATALVGGGVVAGATRAGARRSGS
jgi:putative ABC transport system permease protein